MLMSIKHLPSTVIQGAHHMQQGTPASNMTEVEEFVERAADDSINESPAPLPTTSGYVNPYPDQISPSNPHATTSNAVSLDAAYLDAIRSSQGMCIVPKFFRQASSVSFS
jgi:hypothetical protein